MARRRRIPRDSFVERHAGKLFAGTVLAAVGLVVALGIRRRRRPRFVAPLIPARVTSGWGEPRPYRRGTHEGIDLLAPVGTPVVAVADGTVEKVVLDPCQAAGLHVIVLHDGAQAPGFRTSYLHLSRVDVEEGWRVAQGEQLGLSGATGGAATGPGCTFADAAPHLHLTVSLRADLVSSGMPTGTARGDYVAVPAEAFIPAAYDPAVVARAEAAGIVIAVG